MDLLQHTDYMGNPIETEEQYAHYILSMFEPIWMEQGLNPMLFPQFVQDYEIPEGAARKLVIPGELFGLRTFPESRWIKFYDKVNELVSHLPIDMIDEKQAKAWREGKLGWKNLTAQQQQYLLQNYPELSELYQQAIADSALKDSKVWKNWNTRMEAEKATYYEQLAKLDQQLKDGTITTAQYREAASLAGQNYGYAIQSIENDPNYAEIYEYISNAEDPGVNYGFTDSLALAEYESTILYAGDLELSNGDYDWAERDRRTDAFIEKWGQKTYDDIQTYLLNKKSSKGMSQIAIKKAEDTQKLGREYWRLPWKEIASMNAAEAAELGPVYKTMWDNLQAITDPDERTAYLKSHPELTKDWRAEYRKANPEIDAMLALWGYSGKIQSVEAYNLVMQWVKELGISTQSLGLEFPTAKILQNYLEYNDMVGQYGANSYEAKLYRIEHPEWDKYGQDAYGWKAIDTTVNPELLKLNIQWRDSDSEYDSITDSAARAAYLETHPEYHDARLTRNAIEAGFDSQFIPAYKTYYKLPATRYEQEWYLIENQQFYQKAKELLGWQDKDFSKVPTRKVSGLLDEYNKLPEGTARKKFRLEHPELDAYFVLAKGYKPASDAYMNIPRSQVFAWDEFNQ
jgi:hypothetical protein